MLTDLLFAVASAAAFLYLEIFEMSNLQVFNFDANTAIRTSMVDGVIWFVAKDMAEALEYPESKNALRLCKNSNSPPNGELNKINDLPPATKWINESDLYRLIMHSTKPEAEKFQDWVCEEVLPTIRKTGSYSFVPEVKGTEISQTAIAMLDLAKAYGFEGNQALISADKATFKLIGQSPLKLLGAELISDQERHLNPTEVGRRFDPALSAIKINLKLAEKGLQFKNEEDKWMPTEQGKEFGVLIDTEKRRSNGTPVQQLKWKESVISKLGESK